MIERGGAGKTKIALDLLKIFLITGMPGGLNFMRRRDSSDSRTFPNGMGGNLPWS
jgi:hypothetical protein